MPYKDPDKRRAAVRASKAKRKARNPALYRIDGAEEQKQRCARAEEEEQADAGTAGIPASTNRASSLRATTASRPNGPRFGWTSTGRSARRDSQDALP